MNIFKWFKSLKTDKKNSIRVLVTPYVDPKMKELTKKRWYIKNGAKVGHLNLIVLRAGAAEPLEIIYENDLYKPFHPAFDLTVVGFSDDKDGAFELVRQIYQDMYDEMGRAMDVVAFFSRFEEYEPSGGV